MSDSLSRRSFLSLAGGTAVAIAGLGLVGCGGSYSSGSSPSSDSSAKALSGTVNCSGATSFQPLVEAAARKFEDENPDVTIAITGGGSGQGLSDVRDGKAQIGRSDVFAEQKLDASDAKALTDNTVCMVGMGPIVNSSVDVDDLTTDQLKGIFTGQIADWSQVGGTAGKTQVIERKAGSGTRATFEAAVLGGEKAPDSFSPVAEEDSSGTVVEKIQQTEVPSRTWPSPTSMTQSSRRSRSTAWRPRPRTSATAPSRSGLTSTCTPRTPTRSPRRSSTT